MSVRYLLDTDWVIHYLNGHPTITQRLGELYTDGLAISVVSLAELYEGVYYSRDPQRDEELLENFLASITLLSIDEETCKIFGKERGRLRATGKTIGDFDLLIGSLALQHHLTLLTNNRRHFEVITGLTLESLQ